MHDRVCIRANAAFFFKSWDGLGFSGRHKAVGNRGLGAGPCTVHYVPEDDEVRVA